MLFLTLFIKHYPTSKYDYLISIASYDFHKDNYACSARLKFNQKKRMNDGLFS